MDTDRLVELVPHYVAMLVLVFVVLFAVEAVAGELDFWMELVVIVLVVFAYRPLVLWLDVAPSSWRDR